MKEWDGIILKLNTTGPQYSMFSVLAMATAASENTKPEDTKLPEDTKPEDTGHCQVKKPEYDC